VEDVFVKHVDVAPRCMDGCRRLAVSGGGHDDHQHCIGAWWLAPLARSPRRCPRRPPDRLHVTNALGAALVGRRRHRLLAIPDAGEFG
jgi:hypothetical protein